MATPSPYKSLPAERRAALVLHSMKSNRDARALWASRLAAKGGGFRMVTLMSWPTDKLAKEVVRLGAETPQDELELLQLLYLEVQPEIQATFLDAAGVQHENGRMPEELEPPYADADAVKRAVPAVREAHGEDGDRYVRTLVRYAREAWPGIETVAPELGA